METTLPTLPGAQANGYSEAVQQLQRALNLQASPEIALPDERQGYSANPLRKLVNAINGTAPVENPPTIPPLPYRTIGGHTYMTVAEAADHTWAVLQQDLDRRMHGDLRIKGYKADVLRWLLGHNICEGKTAKTKQIERDMRLPDGTLARPVADLAKRLLIQTFRQAYGGITLTAEGVNAAKSLPPDTSY